MTRYFPVRGQPPSPLTQHLGGRITSFNHQAHHTRKHLTTGCQVPWGQDNGAASLLPHPHLQALALGPRPSLLTSRSPEILTILTEVIGPCGAQTWAPKEKERSKVGGGAAIRTLTRESGMVSPSGLNRVSSEHLSRGYECKQRTQKHTCTHMYTYARHFQRVHGVFTGSVMYQ